MAARGNAGDHPAGANAEAAEAPTAPSAPTPHPPPHPGRFLFFVYGALGALFLGIAGLLAIDLSLVGAVVSGTAGVLALAFRRMVRRRLRAVPATNAAAGELTRGDADAAEALLATVPIDALRDPVIRRAHAIARSMIALERGDATSAVTHATSAVDGKASPFGVAFERQQ